MRTLVLSILGLGLVVLSLTGCKEPELASLPPEEIVSSSAERMNSLEGFYFVIERSGAPAFLDLDETISFRRAEGFYSAPDRSQATVRVIAPGLVTDVDVISIGETQWETNMLTAEWRELPPNWGFNPAVLFDAEIGIQSILTTDLDNMALMEPEKLADGPETSLYVLSGTLEGDRIYEMSYGLIGPKAMTVQMWIAPESFELIRVEVTDPKAGGEDDATVWQIDFSRFGELVNIVPPVTTDE